MAVPKLITASQLTIYAELILHITGIRISPQKKMLLSNRIGRRLNATGIDSYDDYYEMLKQKPPEDPEWDAFIQEITTHETYLFRDEPHWSWFREQYLPELSRAGIRGKRKKKLRIWSAACSTGDEAYTLASCIADSLPYHQQWKIEIVGTDIGTGAVDAAKKAEFGQRAMRLVPQKILKRWFVQQGTQEIWTPRPELKKWTTFKQHNLMDCLTMKPFDLVILKNVLIYFSNDAKQKAVENLCKKILPGGILITSAADNISSYMEGYNKKTPWLFTRQESTPVLRRKLEIVR